MVVAMRKIGQLEPGLGNWLGFTFTNRPWLSKPVGAILMQAFRGQLLCPQVSFQPDKLCKYWKRQTRRLLISHWFWGRPQEPQVVISIYSKEIRRKSSRTCGGQWHRLENITPHLSLCFRDAAGLPHTDCPVHNFVRISLLNEPFPTDVKGWVAWTLKEED